MYIYICVAMCLSIGNKETGRDEISKQASKYLMI